MSINNQSTIDSNFNTLSTTFRHFHSSKESIFDGLWMTSVEIAEKVGKSHKHILADVKTLIERGSIIEPSYRPITINVRVGFGYRKDPAYDLDFQATLLLVTGYDIDRRKAVIARWMELENEKQRVQQPADPMQILQDPQAMRGLLLSYTERVISLETKVEEDAPKVAYVDDVICQTEGLITLGDFGRVLKSGSFPTGARKIFTQLRVLGIIRPNKAIPYSKYIDRGYFVVTERVRDDRVDLTTLVTGKGQLWIHNQLKLSLSN